MFVAGIDAHTRYVVVYVVDRTTGEGVLGPRRVKVEAPERLLAALAPFRPLEAVVETSSAWPWLADVLAPAGVRLVLAHARRLVAIAEATYKRDDIDAELLARMRLAGLIPEVYVAPPAQREWAALVRHRVALVALRTALLNRVHAQLHQRGLALARGRLTTRAGREWLRAVAWPRLSAEQRALVRSHRRLVRCLAPMLRAVDRRIAAVAAAIPEARLLQTIPGVGPYRALLLCAEVLPITRFPTPGRLASYAGLAPRSSQSGERGVRHGPIPAGANRWVRGALVRAVVSHVRYESADASWLTRYYAAQKARLGWPVARVAAARKLARAMHAMLRTNTPWNADPSRGELAISHGATA